MSTDKQIRQVCVHRARCLLGLLAVQIGGYLLAGHGPPSVTERDSISGPPGDEIIDDARQGPMRLRARKTNAGGDALWCALVEQGRRNAAPGATLAPVRQSGEHLEHYPVGQERGDIGAVVRRGHLDDVHADDR